MQLSGCNACGVNDSFLAQEELVKGVERLKGTAKGIDLAAFIAEYRRFARIGQNLSHNKPRS